MTAAAKSQPTDRRARPTPFFVLSIPENARSTKKQTALPAVERPLGTQIQTISPENDDEHDDHDGDDRSHGVADLFDLLLLFFVHYASLPLIRFVFLACTMFTPNRIRNETASVTSAIDVALS